MSIKEEFNEIIHEFLSSDSESLKAVATELRIISEAHKAGQIDESMKAELFEDVAELSRVETAAEKLEIKIQVEDALRLLSQLVKLI